MIQQTVDRLLPLSAIQNLLVITSSALAETIRLQLPELPSSRLVVEPCPRNTAAAFALATVLTARSNPKAVLGFFPSDHVIREDGIFQQRIRSGIHLASHGELVILGIPPTRPETGYGYIETQRYASSSDAQGIETAFNVLRFTEKPDAERASAFLRNGNYLWNSGMVLCRADILLDLFRKHCPALTDLLDGAMSAAGTPAFSAALAAAYGAMESISFDFAILEPHSCYDHEAPQIVCVPGDFGWNDLGSWNALHEHLLGTSESASCGNVIDACSSFAINATGNYVFAPGLTVALLGVDKVVVVQTEDAILITTHEHCQQIGKLVSEFTRTERLDLI